HAKAYRIQPHQIDLLRKKPTRVVFPEAGRLDERKTLEVSGVGLQIGARLRQHAVLLERRSFGDLNAPDVARGSIAPLYQQCSGRKSGISYSSSTSVLPRISTRDSRPRNDMPRRVRSDAPLWDTTAGTLRTVISPI